MKTFILCVLYACHPTTTEDKPKPAAKADAAHDDGKPKVIPTLTTSRTTREMFKREGLKKMQKALAEKNGKEVKETGVLDRPTQDALRAFQRKEGLAETGMPDFEAIRRLGLEPDEVFHHKTPGERIGVK